MRTRHQTGRSRARASDGATATPVLRNPTRSVTPGESRAAGELLRARELTLTFIKNRETRTVVRFDVQVQGGAIVGFAVLRKSTLAQINNPQGFKVVLNPP
jgi:hypothetical protein